MRRRHSEKTTMVAGAIGVALLCAAFGVSGKPGSGAGGGKYHVVIANGRGARAPIS